MGKYIVQNLIKTEFIHPTLIRITSITLTVDLLLSFKNIHPIIRQPVFLNKKHSDPYDTPLSDEMLYL